MADEKREVKVEPKAEAEPEGPALNDPVGLLVAAAEALERRRAGRLKTYGLVAQEIRALAARVEEIG